MKKFLIGAQIFAVSLFAVSCSDDEGNRETTTSGFYFNSSFYALNQAGFEDLNVVDETPSDIELTLSNVNLSLENAVSNVAIVHFSIPNLEVLQTGNFETLTSYSVEVGSYFDAEGELVTGTYLLNSNQTGLMASSVNVEITRVAEDNNSIDLLFTFTRSDGQTITGTYSGTLTDNTVTPE